MKRIVPLLLLVTLGTGAWAQKKPLDHDAYDGWQSVSGTVLSPSGKVVSYSVNPQEGDGTLYFRISGKKGAHVISVPRGYRAQILDNDAYAVCLIKPEFQKTRRAKIKKLTGDKLPQDSLAIINLQNGRITKYPNVKSFQLGLHAVDQFAFATIDTTFAKKVEKDMGTPVAVYHFADGHLDTLKNVDKYGFSKDGKTMAFIRKTDKKHSVVGFYAGDEFRTLPDTATFHALPTFNEYGSEALYLQSLDTASTGSKHTSLWLYHVDRNEPWEIVKADQRRNMPENWGLTENSSYFFSRENGTIFAGIQEYVPVKDTNLVSFETPGLDIWNWNADEIPPRMKANLARDKRRTYPCMYQDEGLIPISTRKADRLVFGDHYDADVVLKVATVNPVETQWNIQNETAISIFYLGSGREVEFARGAVDGAQLSPRGRYAIWWDLQQRNWFAYDVWEEKVINLTGGIDTVFWNEKDDHPAWPDPYGLGPWMNGENAILLYDRYDIWQVNLADGKATKLTDGRAQKRTYRYLPTKDSEADPTIGPAETIYLSVFDETTKENGLASYTFGKKSILKTLEFGGYTWSGLQKAKNAPVFTYFKGNFQNPMDLYVTDFGNSTERITSINPQQKHYNWGTAVQAGGLRREQEVPGHGLFLRDLFRESVQVRDAAAQLVHGQSRLLHFARLCGLRPGHRLYARHARPVGLQLHRERRGVPDPVSVDRQGQHGHPGPELGRLRSGLPHYPDRHVQSGRRRRPCRQHDIGLRRHPLGIRHEPAVPVRADAEPHRPGPLERT